MKNITVLLAALVCLSSGSSFADDSKPVDVYHQTLSQATAAELPLKSAEMVKQAPKNDLTQATIRTVKAALDIKPASAPAIVAAISRSVPDAAPVAAGTAAEQQPKQAALVARAAAAAAPSKAGKIVEAVCRAVPNAYHSIAVSVAEVVPASGKEILDAVAAAVPGMKSLIQQTLLAYNGNVSSVAAVLDQAQSLAVAKNNAGASAMATPLSLTPAGGPSYIPLSGTPSDSSPGSGGVIPIGGRGYASP